MRAALRRALARFKAGRTDHLRPKPFTKARGTGSVTSARARQREVERAAAAHLALDPNASAMNSDDTGCDR